MDRPPFTVAVRSASWAASVGPWARGQVYLRTGHRLADLPLSDGLDVIYALVVEDANGLVDRGEIRTKLDLALNRPLDPEDAAEYDRANWGLDAEAIAAEANMANMPGGTTYGEPEGVV